MEKPTSPFQRPGMARLVGQGQVGGDLLTLAQHDLIEWVEIVTKPLEHTVSQPAAATAAIGGANEALMGGMSGYYGALQASFGRFSGYLLQQSRVNSLQSFGMGTAMLSRGMPVFGIDSDDDDARQVGAGRYADYAG